MNIKIYQVDAFTDRIFSGNPAAVCPLESWIDDELLQKIALENNLSETAFFVKKDDKYEIRWFTPTVEVDLCGHATLASAYVIFNHENHTDDVIHFSSLRSGELTVSKKDDFYTLNFPTDEILETDMKDEIRYGFDIMPIEVWKGKSDYLLVFENENQIKTIKPNLAEIVKLKARGVIITAKGDEVDFVSRFFGPQCGVDEDPVTGSAHTTLIPYWYNKLNKIELTAQQLSARKGYLKCKYMGDRVLISGQARLFMKGEINL